MKIMYARFIYAALFVLVWGCDLEKDIQVPLPPYESKLVIECYLEAGKPYRMTVSESASYFASPEIPDVNDASVRIKANGNTSTLRYNIEVDEKNRKAYNYTSFNIVKPATEYQLEVTDTKGRKVTGTARLLPMVSLKEVEWKYNDDSTSAFLLTHFDDDPATDDYYRFQVHRDSLNKGADVDFTLDDSFATGNEITIGTGYNYEPGDTVYVTVYHIERSYYDFLESIESASNANGNPFAQPATVKSTVQGGIGVFAVLVYDRKKIVIE